MLLQDEAGAAKGDEGLPGKGITLAPSTMTPKGGGVSATNVEMVRMIDQQPWDWICEHTIAKVGVQRSSASWRLERAQR